ncbi:MAG: holo-ACP synthase [Ideonella sp.]
MIFGIGTDVCDIRRIRATWERRGQRFAERILGPHELQVFNARLQKVEARGISFLATRFSAKEAFSKAIGVGMHPPMTWRNCEILNLPGGKPVLRLSGVLAEWFESRQLVGHVSVSDETDIATSFVVVESNTVNPKEQDGSAHVRT